MTEITVYTSNFCPYCIMTKRLLNNKGVTYREINVDETPDMRQEMMLRTKRRTVPQIYIGEFHVGGFDDLYLLDREQRLDSLLEPFQAPSV